MELTMTVANMDFTLEIEKVILKRTQQQFIVDLLVWETKKKRSKEETNGSLTSGPNFGDSFTCYFFS